MTKYIALLRGVNVGGNRKLPMGDLRDRLQHLGYTDVRTLLASGNVVFTGAATDARALEATLEADLKSALGLHTDVMVRDPAQWGALLAANPFPAEALADPAHLVLLVLKAPPAAAAVKAVLARNGGNERLHVHGREAFIYYPDGIGDSKLDLKPLGSGTARNWNTVLKLQALVAGAA